MSVTLTPAQHRANYLARLKDPSISWDGALNEENVKLVAARIRAVFEGQKFAIASEHYIDRDYTRPHYSPELRLITDATFNSEWTDRAKIMVRVWLKGTPYDSGLKGDHSRSVISFSAGGYAWSFHAGPDDIRDNDDYHTPDFSFEYDQMTITQRAPAGKGYLHRHVFRVQRKD